MRTWDEHACYNAGGSALNYLLDLARFLKDAPPRWAVCIVWAVIVFIGLTFVTPRGLSIPIAGAMGACAFAAWIYSRIDLRKEDACMAEYLGALATEEKRIFLLFLNTGQRSITGDRFNNYAIGMVGKKMLLRTDDIPHARRVAYTIPNAVWTRLQGMRAKGEIDWKDAEQGLAAWEEQFRRGPRSWA